MKIEGSIRLSVIERTTNRVVFGNAHSGWHKECLRSCSRGCNLVVRGCNSTVLVIDSDHVSEGMKGFPLAITLNANFVGNQKDGMLKSVSSLVKHGKTC